MKNKTFKYLFLILIALSANTICDAQDDISIKIFMSRNGDKVKLRWQPANSETSDLIQQYGVTIVRKEFVPCPPPVDPGQAVAPEPYGLEASEDPESPAGENLPDPKYTQIVSGLFPLTQSEFSAHAIRSTPSGNAAYELIYGNAPIITGNGLSQALKINQSKENRFSFLNAVAIRNFQLAKLLALGIEDVLPCQGKYTYQISIGDHKQEYSFNYIEPEPSYAVKPFIFGTTGSNRKVELSFDQALLTQGYFGFYIERSLDSLTNYVQLNATPYAQSYNQADAKASTRASYIDTVPQNNVKYFYRIKAENMFNQFSEYSEIVSGKAIPPRLPIEPNLSIKLITDNAVIFRIPVVPSQYQNKISKITLYKSADISKDYVIAMPNTTILPSDSVIMDDQLIGSVYYMLTYLDENNHYYQTTPIMVQAKDITPPAIPRGLAANVKQDGTITLSWGKNEDFDLSAYRLYRSNGRTGAFIDVSGDDIIDTTYIDYLPNNVLIDSAFYKMIATDYRGNYSDYSEIVGISRPDALAPSNPVLFSGIGSTDGIYLHWEPSYSSDVDHHVLERSSPTETWTSILTFTPKQTQYYTTQQGTVGSYTYIDNNNILNQEYTYRLVAYDDNGNIASSGTVSVIPMVSLVEGKITWIDEFHTCDQTLSSESQSKMTGISQAISAINASGTPTNVKNTLLQLLQNGFITVTQYQALSGQPSTVISQDLLGLSNAIVANEKKKCYINVKWRYVHKDINDNTKYEIYRATNNFTFDLYKTLKHSEIEHTDDTNYKWTDTAVLHGRKYSYKIIALNTNNTSSKLSNTVSAVLE